MGSISENISIIRNEIKKICDAKGQDYEKITLIAVTKTIDTTRIREVINSGINDIGENKVQEIMDKYEELKNLSNFHLIGHLQSNKVKYIIDKVRLIHSVDSLNLMDAINKRAKKSQVIANILIQVNVACEDTKFGIALEDLEHCIQYASKLENIKVQGLMTIAPYYEDPEQVRPVFKTLKRKFDELSNIDYANIKMKFLSMGMTNDYKIALEEGSNMIRVGTGIFGKRNYNL